jgi:hypothetical protein
LGNQIGSRSWFAIFLAYWMRNAACFTAVGVVIWLIVGWLG